MATEEQYCWPCDSYEPCRQCKKNLELQAKLKADYEAKKLAQQAEHEVPQRIKQEPDNQADFFED